MSLATTLKHAWHTITSGTERNKQYIPVGPSYSSRPDRPRVRPNAERTMVAAIYTRIAVDASAIRLEHVRLDENGLFQETIKSKLNDCLNVEANIDQSARHLRFDIVMTMLSEGTVAIVPVRTSENIFEHNNFEIEDMRVGTILEWMPQHVRVRLYDDRYGRYEEVTLPKRNVAIVENPFYSVMNEPNSTLQRLIHKLSLMDHVDEISSQGKLDIIIQLPYVVKSDTRRNQAKKRVEEIQNQLKESTYGIAYADGTEKITQLNRAVENSLLTQVQYLKDELYAELGLTAEIMNMTAPPTVMHNYTNRVIEAIMDAISENILRKFISKTARTQGQSIMYFDTPLKFIPIEQLGELVDALSRNQIVTPNEIRPAIGLKPSSAPQANALVNSNMPLDDQLTGEPEEDVDAEAAKLEESLDADMAELGL